MDMIVKILLTSAGFTVFALIHSITANRSVKERLISNFPFLNRWYRLLYNIIAILTLGAWLHFSPFPDVELYSLASPWSLLFRIVQLLGFIGFIVSLRSIEGSDITGVKQLMNPGKYGELAERTPGELTTDGLYGWVRHPLYTTSIVILAFNPVMTGRLAAINVLFLLYFWIGSYHEERNLIKQFGDSYVDYQKEVPRLFPKIDLF